MKIVIAKETVSGKRVYINASRISSFHVVEDTYGRKITKIYFEDSKCVVDGDVALELLDFMSNEEDYGTCSLGEKPEESALDRCIKNRNDNQGGDNDE